VITARIAIIGGTGSWHKSLTGTKIRVGTPYGPSPTLIIEKMGENDVVVLPRHGIQHAFPPHMINNRANVFALHHIGIERILAVNTVGAINAKMKPGNIVIPNDFIDFTKSQPVTFYDDGPVTHIDVTSVYCPELRRIIADSAETQGKTVWNDAVYGCTEGPRYESPAEIRMLRTFGCDVVGMTGVPEAILAHELAMCYASICFVSNRAAGMQEKISTEEVVENTKLFERSLRKIINQSIVNIPRKRSCTCANALEGARI
jgi:5'-methylthioadenosine phosphorylase